MVFSKTAAKVSIKNRICKKIAQNVRNSVRKPINEQVMAVSFSIEKRTNKQGEAPVRCSISIQGHRLQTTTRISVNPEFWDSETQRVISSTSAGKIVMNSKQMSAKQMNAELKRIDTWFAEYENTLRVNHQEVGDLKEIFANHFGKASKIHPVEKDEETPDIKARLAAFLKEQRDKEKWRELTVKSMDSFKNHMEDFIDAETVASIDYFDEDGTTSFVNHLLNVKDLRNSTVEKYLSRLRYFIRWANKKGYTTLKGDYRPKLQKTNKPVVFLEWDDLMKLLYFEFPVVGTELTLEDVHGNKYKKKVSLEKDTMERVRDAFCFCCFTSLRYSDLKRLKRTNVFAKYIMLTTKKDTDTLKIELNKYSKTLLDKYREESFPGNQPLPVISEQKMNEHLKVIGEICGFNEPVPVTYFKGSERIDEVYAKWELMTTHVGRKTFICNSLMLGIPPQIVMKWTGHSDYAAMKPYIAIADSAKSDAMAKFNER